MSESNRLVSAAGRPPVDPPRGAARSRWAVVTPWVSTAPRIAVDRHDGEGTW